MKMDNNTIPSASVDKSNARIDKKTLQQSRLALCIASMCFVSGVSANPVAPEVVNGSAQFSQQGSHLEITGADGTIINWQDFSIAAGESVNFLQTHASSAILNRVISNIPSDILGDLTSNGRVFVINPNGLIIGQNAQINTAGFVASTLDMSNEDFIAGRMKFVGDSGEIENHGYIATAPGGEVVLIAPTVENHGIIEAEGGQIMLAAGREVTLHSIQSGGLSYRVSAPGDKAINIGKLVANNGSVKVFADQIFHGGSVSATRAVESADGTIVLEADSAIEVTGTVDVSGNGVDGGNARILGDEVTLQGATVDASGASGGEVLIGGDYQGDGEVKNAANTTVDEATVIRADAGNNGDGGRVIVWSDGVTNSHAKITARGGAQSGDGGFVETSGKKILNFGQAVDVSAANGRAGTWLLDPEDITIDESGAASIETSLNSGSNVEVRTSDEGDGEGNITVDAPITKTEGDTEVTLTLDAHNQVHVNAPISTTAGPLNVSIKTGRQVAVSEEALTTSQNDQNDNQEQITNDNDSGSDESQSTTETSTDDSAPSTDESDSTDDSSNEQETDSGDDTTNQDGSEQSTETETDSESGSDSDNEIASTNSEQESSDVQGSSDAEESTDGQESTEGQEQQTVDNEEVDANAESQNADSENDQTTATQSTDNDSSDQSDNSSSQANDSEQVNDAQQVSNDVVETVEQTATQSNANQAHADSQAVNLIDDSEQQIVIAADIFTGGGDVEIDAGADGDAIIIADIDTTDHDGDVAGDITVEAENIAVLDDAEIDASDEVAGEILIGGGQQGQDPDVDNANVVLIGDDATISADGGENGDGGRVIVFSEHTSIVSGNLSARGGSQSGDGGFVETSALQNIRIGGTPDVTASNGQGGTWLIDPRDITILSGDTSANVDTSVIGMAETFTPNYFAGTTYGTPNSQVNGDYIINALYAGSNVVIDTNGSPDVAGEYGDITFNANIQLTMGNNPLSGSLTLNAARDITFNGTIDSYLGYGSVYATGEMDVSFNAARNITLSDGSEITTAGDVTLYSGSGAMAAGNITSSANLTVGEGTTGSFMATARDGSVSFSIGGDSLGKVRAYENISVIADTGITVDSLLSSGSGNISLTTAAGADIQLNSNAAVSANRGEVIVDSGRDISTNNSQVAGYNGATLKADRNLTISGSSRISAGPVEFSVGPGTVAMPNPKVTLKANDAGTYTGFTDGGDNNGVITVKNEGAQLLIAASDISTTTSAISFEGAGLSIESSAYDTSSSGGSTLSVYQNRGIDIQATSVEIGNSSSAITGDIRILGGAPTAGAPASLAGGGVRIEATEGMSLNSTDDITIRSNNSDGVTYAQHDVNIHADLNLSLEAQDITVTSGNGSAASVSLIAHADVMSVHQGLGTLAIKADNLILDGRGTGTTTATAKDDINVVAENTLTLTISENAQFLGNEKNSVVSGVTSSSANMLTDDAKTFSTSVVSYGDLTANITGNLTMTSSEVLLLSERYDMLSNPHFGENGALSNVDQISVANLYANNALIAFDRDSSATNASSAPGQLILTTTGSASTINGPANPELTTDPDDFGLKLNSVIWQQQGTVDWQSGSLEVGLADVAFQSSIGGGMTAVAHESDITNSGVFKANSETGVFSMADSGGRDDFNNEGTFTKDSGSGTTLLDLDFVNMEVIEASSGTLNFGAGSFLQTLSLGSSGGFGTFTLPDLRFTLNGGNVAVDAMSAGLFFQGGLINGGSDASNPNGIINSDVTVQNTTIAPGFSPGNLTINGNFNASAGGNTFEFEVYGGNNQPKTYDQLVINGTADIPNSGSNGTNNITLTGNISTNVPSPLSVGTTYSETFRVITATNIGVIGGSLVDNGSDTATFTVTGAGVDPMLGGGSYSVGATNTTNGSTFFDVTRDITVDAGTGVPIHTPVPEPEPEPEVVVANSASVAMPPVSGSTPPSAPPQSEPEVIVIIVDDVPLVLPREVVNILVTLRKQERRTFLQSERVREKLRKVNMCASDQT